MPADSHASGELQPAAGSLLATDPNQLPLDLFLELAAIASPPGRERAVADRVLAFLRALDLEPDEDDAGARIGSEIGNIYCRVEPTAAVAACEATRKALVEDVGRAGSCAAAFDLPTLRASGRRRSAPVVRASS